jgi:hypothetical protein
VPPGDATALADALRALAEDRAELAGLRKAARDLARQSFAADQVVAPLAARLDETNRVRGRRGRKTLTAPH